MTNIGKLEVVSVRKAFPHEALNFTKWLEEHIDALADRLKISLSVEQREKSVGDFSVDLLCEDDDGKPVIIENQLGKTWVEINATFFHSLRAHKKQKKTAY